MKQSKSKVKGIIEAKKKKNYIATATSTDGKYTTKKPYNLGMVTAKDKNEAHSEFMKDYTHNELKKVRVEEEIPHLKRIGWNKERIQEYKVRNKL